MDNTANPYDNASFWDIPTTTCDSTEALAFFQNPNNFPSFSQGLTCLLGSHGYQGPRDDAGQKAEFLYRKLSDIGVSVSKSTITDWFTGKRRPALVSNSRLLIRQICFALSLTLEEAAQFFRQVYYDRFFHCHTIEEAVSYYCLSNRLPYSHAQELLAKIEAFPDNGQPSGPVLTKNIQKRLDSCRSDSMLLSFFQEEKHTFTSWNISAQNAIRNLLSVIQGSQKDKDFLQALSKGTAGSKKPHSLILQELFYDKGAALLGDIRRKNVASRDFMLDCILHAPNGIAKDVAIPKILHTNFPTKKTFSKILNEIEKSTSYDSIRKCLILLKFYDFWCRGKLAQDKTPYDFDTYTAEMNDLLLECGYGSMYQGNPYDFLFLWAATTEDPLGYLRDAVGRTIYLQAPSA